MVQRLKLISNDPIQSKICSLKVTESLTPEKEQGVELYLLIVHIKGVLGTLIESKHLVNFLVEVIYLQTYTRLNDYISSLFFLGIL